MKINKLTWTILTALAFVACTSEDMERQMVTDGTVRFAPQMASDWNAPWMTRAKAEANMKVQALQGADELYLHTIVSPGIQRNLDVTRGTKYEGIAVPGETYRTFATDGSEAFRVSGYRYAGNSSVNSVTSANFINNAIVSYDGDWRVTGLNYVMPAATDLIDFFGWFVTDEATAGITAVDAAGGLQLTYDMPIEIANQPDLLAAVTRSQTYSPAASALVPLQFNHQLSAISFVLDENVAPGTINEIAFMNVYTKGTLAFDVQNGTAGTWTLINAPEVTAYEVNFPTVVNDELQNGETILSGLMMIPQEFTGEEQQIRIKMTIDGTQRNLFANLQGTEWEAGSTITYKISTSAVNVLRISDLTYPTSWSAASTENSDIKSAYTDGDEIGVFGVDATGHVLFANNKYTLTDNKWVADDGTKSLYVPGATFYAYYPYQATLSGAPVESSETTILVNNALPTAAQFFSNVITNWAPAENQSTAALLNAQDLQIGRSTPSAVSTVSFPTMAHAMGLTSLTLAQGSIPETRFFIVNSNGNETSSYVDSNETITVTASTDFTNPDIENINTKMLIKERKYYYVVNPQKETITVTGPAEGDERWSTPNVALEVTAGNFQNINVNHPKAYYYKGWQYEYHNNNYQTFTASNDGTYRIECWGASGGSSTYSGHGAYVAGNISLDDNTSLYLFVGGRGNTATSNTTNSTTSGGYNGGGTCIRDASSGGGASDVRLISGTWNNTASLRSRIIVAGGGGGEETTTGYGGAGGGLIAPKVYGRAGNTSANYYITGGTQTSGGVPDSKAGGGNGTFGTGGNSSSNLYGGGGGGGWYGGAGGCNTPQNQSGDIGGTGGSSFISGHVGCNGINSSGSHQGAGNPSIITVNNVAKTIIFSNTKMIDGDGNLWDTASNPTTKERMPNPLGGSYNIGVGHLGHGYVRIGARFLMDE